MTRWPTLRKALIFCLPALATGLFMDQWGLRTIAWAFIFLTMFVFCVFSGIRAIEWMASPKGTTRTHPFLIFVAVIASYALLSALLGTWWVEYRLTSLCERIQSQIRTLPPGTRPESIPFKATHRLIFSQAKVRTYLDPQNRITFVIEDQRDLFYSAYHVSADEIRYHRD